MKSRDLVAFVFASGRRGAEPFLLPVLGIPTIERVIRSLRGGGIEEVFVFTDLAELREAAEGWSVDPVDPKKGDIERIVRGRVLLGVEGDLPLLSPQSIAGLIDRFDPDGEALLRAEGAPVFISIGGSPLIGALKGSPADLESVIDRYAKGGGTVRFDLPLPSDQAIRLLDRRDLPRIEGIARRRRIDSLLEDRVSIVDLERTYVEEDVSVGSGTTLYPGVHLRGATRIGRDCTIGPDAFIEDSIIEDRSIVRYSVIEGSRVREGSSIGPYSHLRPGADVGPEARVGNFVEVKAARLGRGVKAGHLSYIGDAEVGDGTNIGAGTVTCNYDGVRKNKTVIEEGAFIGSNSSLVAPLRIGQGAFIAAGSTITDDVPPERIAFGRARQVVKERKEEGDDREEAQAPDRERQS